MNTPKHSDSLGDAAMYGAELPEFELPEEEDGQQSKGNTENNQPSITDLHRRDDSNDRDCGGDHADCGGGEVNDGTTSGTNHQPADMDTDICGERVGDPDRQVDGGQVDATPKITQAPPVASPGNPESAGDVGAVRGSGVVELEAETVVPHVARDAVTPEESTIATRGKPVVEFGKGSKGTWQFRLRWNSAPGRPVVYVATVTDAVFEQIRKGDYEGYKRQTIEAYEARTLSARHTA